ncbi:hypothetical protein ANCCAN_12653 [Ancylostoma caninum]|uniref:Uncharacterized protein n=1 Tax=Ancylostoma caninum TaxID=29170 RepID=A0A368GAG0_ANCCA|nr:hypothetical protein ANCCAN_12653 [Ancylostoma caninum]
MSAPDELRGEMPQGDGSPGTLPLVSYDLAVTPSDSSTEQAVSDVPVTSETATESSVAGKFTDSAMDQSVSLSVYSHDLAASQDDNLAPPAPFDDNHLLAEGSVSGAESCEERGSSVLSEPMEVSPCGDFGEDETWNPSSEALVTGAPTSSRPFTLVDVPLAVPPNLRDAHLDNLLKYPATTPRRPRSCSPPITSATHCIAGGNTPALSRSDQPSTSSVPPPSSSRGAYESHRSRARGGGRGAGRINVSSRGTARGSLQTAPTATASGPSRGQPSSSRASRGSHGSRGARGRLLRGGRHDREYRDKLMLAYYSRGLPESTPEGYWHPLVPHHPWAKYRSQTVIQQVFSGAYRRVENTHPRTPADQFVGLVAPPTIDGIRTVLYQIIQSGRGTGVVLEAKDFFIMKPDRPDLHCIILDQFGTNIQTETRGFARTLVSVKDYVWFYDVEPTNAALRNPGLTLQQAQIPRTTALDNNTNFFFRAARFAFVRPAQLSQEVYGIVLSVPRRGDNAVNNIRAVFEGAPDAVAVPPSLCDFDLTPAEEKEMVLAHSRLNMSTAVRFSEPPVSKAARAALAHAIQSFVPLHPQQGILPLRVFELPPAEQNWLADRARPFENYRRDPEAAKVRMARVFSVFCAALSAINTIDDDRHSHWVTASVLPSMNEYPIRFDLRLTDKISEAEWTVQRPVELWVEGSPELSRARVMAVQANSEACELNVTLAAYRDTDNEPVRSIRSYGHRVGMDTFVRFCVKIGRVPNTANPALETIARKEVFKHVDEDSLAYIIMDKDYSADRRHLGDNEVPYVEDRVVHTIRGRQIALTDDQRDALGLSSCGRSIVAIQAAFGTGKTVLGANAVKNLDNIPIQRRANLVSSHILVDVQSQKGPLRPSLVLILRPHSYIETALARLQ